MNINDIVRATNDENTAAWAIYAHLRGKGMSPRDVHYAFDAAQCITGQLARDVLTGTSTVAQAAHRLMECFRGAPYMFLGSRAA